MFKNKFFLFLYASTTGVFINLVGRLMLAEIIALVMLPFIKIKPLLKQHKDLKVVLGGLLILLLAQIASDIVNNSIPSDYLRGWAVIVFAIILTIYLVNYLSPNINNIVYYLFAIMLVNLFFGKGELDPGLLEDNTNYIEVRFVGFLNPAMLLAGYYLFSKNKTRSVVLLFLVFGFVCMALDARSNGLVFILSGILIYIKVARIRLSKLKIFVLTLSVSSVLYVGYVFYVNEVLYHGFGGTNASTQLKKTSNPYNPFELLYYGRTEFVVLFYAAMDNPIFGHGSWGQDKGGKYAKLSAKITKTRSSKRPGYIHAHSFFRHMGLCRYRWVFSINSRIFYTF
ncbi:MAG: hypothetical protein IPF54_08380 [Draconibacterium sp.]|nr:hypothetical protein [Draconibacterium sp.]